MIEHYEGPFRIEFDFDAEGEPPAVNIVQTNGMIIMEIFEEPTMPNGGKNVELERGIWGWVGKWSWEPEDWEPGPFALYVVDLLNANPPESAATGGAA